MPPAELEEQLAEAREEAVAEDLRSAEELREAICSITGHLPGYDTTGPDEAPLAWCGYQLHDGREGVEWCRLRGVSSNENGQTFTAAAQALLAAVSAPEPCPCKGAEWVDGDDWWFLARHDEVMDAVGLPGDPCPLCDDPLPPKPVEAMTEDEIWAEAPEGLMAYRRSGYWHADYELPFTEPPKYFSRPAAARCTALRLWLTDWRKREEAAPDA